MVETLLDSFKQRREFCFYDFKQYFRKNRYYKYNIILENNYELIINYFF